MPTLQIRPLRPEDERRSFQSGDPDLDRFFHLFAGQNQFRHYIGMTYVAEADSHMLGYMTLSASTLACEDLPKSRQKKWPRYPLPVLRLARLAVDHRARGKGIGKALLRDCFLKARAMKDSVGCIGVVVDAKTDAVPFYERYGFTPLELESGASPIRPRPAPMFLPVTAIPGPGNSYCRE